MIFKEKSRQTKSVSKSIPSADALGYNSVIPTGFAVLNLPNADALGYNNAIPPGFTALSLPSAYALGYDSFIPPVFLSGLAMKRSCGATSRRNFKPKQNPYL